MARRQEALDSYVKEFEEKGMEAYGIAADAADYGGFIFGSPVYYSGINGNLMSFMDRVFFSASAQEPHPFRFKPAAAVVSARRAGTNHGIELPKQEESRMSTNFIR